MSERNELESRRSSSKVELTGKTNLEKHNAIFPHSLPVSWLAQALDATYPGRVREVLGELDLSDDGPLSVESVHWHLAARKTPIRAKG